MWRASISLFIRNIAATAEGLAACRSVRASKGKSVATWSGTKNRFKNSPLPHKRSTDLDLLSQKILVRQGWVPRMSFRRAP